MGRFFNVSDPGFVDDNMYQAPWDIMYNALNTKEQQADEMVAKSELLEGFVDQIPHLNFEAENQRVQEIQGKYQTRVDDLTNLIYEDPLSYQKHQGELKKLQKEMVADKTSGEWYNIEQRHNDVQNWMAENADMKTKNPGKYNLGLNKFYGDIVERGTEDSKARFQGEQLVDRTELNIKYREVLENMKANSKELSNGKYLVKGVELSEEEVMAASWKLLESDKNYEYYMTQMGNTLGQEGYVDNQGRPLEALVRIDSDGNRISPQQYKDMTDVQKEGTKEVFDPNHPFYSDISAAGLIYGYSEISQKEDKYGLQKDKAGHQAALAGQKHGYNLEMEAAKQANRIGILYEKDKLKADAEVRKVRQKAAGGDEEAIEILNQLGIGEVLGVVDTKNVSFLNDFKKMNQAYTNADLDKDGNLVFKPGTYDETTVQRLTNASEYAVNSYTIESDRNGYGDKKIKDISVDLSNGKTFEAQEYIDYLAKNQITHSEEVAQKFLADEKGIFQTPVNTNEQPSVMQNIANKYRGGPNWSKSVQAEDWDAVFYVGEAYNAGMNKWYADNNESKSQVIFDPITNASSNTNIVNNIMANPNAFIITDEKGNELDTKEQETLFENFTAGNQMFVTPASTAAETGVMTKINGQTVYFFPDGKNTAQNNLIINNSLLGVDKNSQYYYEMQNKQANNLIYEIKGTGKNSNGTYSIVKNYNGYDLSIEMAGDEIKVREPDQSLNSEPSMTFPNMHSFTLYMNEYNQNQ